MAYNPQSLLASIDTEIARLVLVRDLLSDSPPVSAKRSKPPKNAPAVPAKRKSNLSPEGRKRIAEAARRRWATQKKAAK